MGGDFNLRVEFRTYARGAMNLHGIVIQSRTTCVLLVSLLPIHTETGGCQSRTSSEISLTAAKGASSCCHYFLPCAELALHGTEKYLDGEDW